MLNAFRLIPAMQIIFTHKIEFTEESFAPLTPEQQEAMKRRGEEMSEPVFRIVQFEPEVIERTPEKITWELSIVTASEKQMLLEGVALVHRATAHMDKHEPTFVERLNYLRPRFPPEVTEMM